MKHKELTNIFVDDTTYIGSVKLRRWSWLPFFRKSTKLYIQPIPIGKAELIGSSLLDMTGVESINQLPPSDQINTLLANNIDPLVYIVGLAVCPKEERPNQHLLTAIREQFTMQQLAEAISEVYRRLDLSPFFDILSLTKSLTLNLIPEAEVPGQE